jgi:hypothetical protein
MATATLPKTPKAPRSRLRMAGYAAVAVLALALIWLAFNFASLKGQARLGVAYGSHVVCSCRYIEGRDLKSCITDLDPGTEMISFADDPAKKRVTASVLLLARASAERRGASGCQVLSDEELKAGE